MFATEEHAKTNWWCPWARVSDNEYSEMSVAGWAFNRERHWERPNNDPKKTPEIIGSTIGPECRCLAFGCGAWRWAVLYRGKDDAEPKLITCPTYGAAELKHNRHRLEGSDSAIGGFCGNPGRPE